MALVTGSLVTLATVKTELGISSSTDDAYLERVIAASTDTISAFCRRTFHYETGIVEKVSGSATPYMTLAKAPLVSIASITYDGSTVDSTDYEIHDAKAGLVYNKGTWIWYATGGAGITHLPKVGTERKMYTVTYTGGYITAAQDNGTTLIRNLPYDLEDACVQLVNYRYKARARDMSIASESLLNASVSYKQPVVTAETLKTLLPSVYDTLRSYTFEPMV